MTILSRNEGHAQHGVEIWIKVLTLYLYVYFVTLYLVVQWLQVWNENETEVLVWGLKATCSKKCLL